MIFTNFKNFDFSHKYKGFKIYITPDIKTFKIYQKSKSIEISRNFSENLNGHQKYFLVTYCIKFYKLKDNVKACNASIDVYKRNGLPEHDILELMDRINENKKLQKFISFNIISWLSKNKIKLQFYKLLNFFNHDRL